MTKTKNKTITEKSEKSLSQVFQLANSTEVKGGQNMANLVNIMNLVKSVLEQINESTETQEEKDSKMQEE